MRRLALALATLVLLVAAAAPARAVWLSENGASAWLTGAINPGDDEAFKAFLERPRAQPLRVLYLSSHGGRLTPAIAMARMVRKAGLTTVVLARSADCSSACTLIFAGGVRRHYVDGDSVFEGSTGMSGLGFHPARRAGNAVTFSTLTEDGTERMRAFYAEMGMPRAVELMREAAINTVFRPNGRTALAMRIATSLAAP